MQNKRSFAGHTDPKPCVAAGISRPQHSSLNNDKHLSRRCWSPLWTCTALAKPVDCLHGNNRRLSRQCISAFGLPKRMTAGPDMGKAGRHGEPGAEGEARRSHSLVATGGREDWSIERASRVQSDGSQRKMPRLPSHVPGRRRLAPLRALPSADRSRLY